MLTQNSYKRQYYFLGLLQHSFLKISEPVGDLLRKLSLSSQKGFSSFTDREWRVDKFIVKSNITSNKLQGFETVSRGSRHRSNHTQKNIRSVVAGHQFLQFGCIGQDTGLFPTTVIVIHLGFSVKTNQFTFQQNCLLQTAYSGFAACLWHLICAKLIFIFQKINKSTITCQKD